MNWRPWDQVAHVLRVYKDSKNWVLCSWSDGGIVNGQGGEKMITYINLILDVLGALSRFISHPVNIFLMAIYVLYTALTAIPPK